jgi:DNA-binding response OmpR family regulator
VTDAKRILVVDDDAAVATMLSRALARHGFKPDTCRTGDEALAKVEEGPYDAAVLDLVMPGRDGADLAGALRAKLPGLTVAFLTGYGHSPLIEAAKRSGRGVFRKPIVVQELVDFLRAELG